MIEINAVSKTIRHAQVLKDITLSLDPGKVAGFSGINGSGKTMLMRTLAGLIKPSAGSVVIDGKTLWKDISFPPSMGILIEGPAFIDSYSGKANLSLIASIKKSIGKDEIEAVLEQVGLDPCDKKKYRKYSLGMKQRLGIAAAVMEQPEVVLLDEPTNALDSKGVAMLKQLVVKERDRGAVVVLSCHDKEILEELADVIYHLEQGSIIKVDHLATGDECL